MDSFTKKIWKSFLKKRIKKTKKELEVTSEKKYIEFLEEHLKSLKNNLDILKDE